MQGNHFDQLPLEMVAAIVDKLDYASVVAFVQAYEHHAWVKQWWKARHLRRVYVADNTGVYKWKTKYV